MDSVEILKKLISIDTSVPPGQNYARALHFLEPLFKRCGLKTQMVAIPAEHAEGRVGRVNLVCHKKAEGMPRLIFYAHIDVVPAQGWDAFSPRVENGKIYGRGAADMKGAIPALLAALEKVKDRQLKYDITVIITTDEELSQASQLHYLQRYILPTQGAIFFDLDSNAGYIAIASLGALQLEITVKGRSVHSGLSHLGENAVEKAVPIMQALLELKKEVTTRQSRVLTHPETGLEFMTARLNINMIKGGLKVNIVPNECVISIDRRLIPEENIEEARSEIIDTLSKVPDVKWEITSEFVIPSHEPCDNPETDKLSAIMKSIIGECGKFGEMGSGDLGNIVIKEWGGKIFGLGVIRTQSNIHGNQEFVNLKDIDDLTEIIARYLVSD
ncbi:MAG TPA: ArgE/DapE family deacylase [Dehalococcoidales bacterium]|nr:ArgE/DapE family deacylase [Dehalococcoidales bacterium]